MVDMVYLLFCLFMFGGACFFGGVEFAALAYKYGRTKKEGFKNEMENI